MCVTIFAEQNIEIHFFYMRESCLKKGEEYLPTATFTCNFSINIFLM